MKAEAGRGGGRGGPASAPPIEADAEASLPLLIEEVKRQLTADQKNRIQARIAKHAVANHDARVAAITQAVESKRAGWNAQSDQHGPALCGTLAADHE